MQTPPLYTLDEALIPSSTVIPTPVLILPVLGQAPTAAPPPIPAVNWERIKKFKSALQAEHIETYKRYKEQ